MSLDHFEERADSWCLRIEGWTVSRISTDPELEIDIVPTTGGGPGSPRFEVAGGEIVGSTDRGLLGSAVREAIIWKDGRLTLSFATGATVAASPKPNVEGWQIVGPDRLFVVCPPGGGEPTIWFGGGDDPSFEFPT